MEIASTTRKQGKSFDNMNVHIVHVYCLCLVSETYCFNERICHNKWTVKMIVELIKCKANWGRKKRILSLKVFTHLMREEFSNFQPSARCKCPCFWIAFISDGPTRLDRSKSYIGHFASFRLLSNYSGDTTPASMHSKRLWFLSSSSYDCNPRRKSSYYIKY